MSNWRQAEDTLKAIQSDLNQEQPNWASALHSTEQVQLLVPDFPLFRQVEPGEPGESLQTDDMRISLLRTDLDQLELGITKTDRELALGSAVSALRNVQGLGRKEKESL